MPVNYSDSNSTKTPAPSHSEPEDIKACDDELTSDEPESTSQTQVISSREDGLLSAPVAFPRRAFLGFCGVLALGTAGALAWRLMPQQMPIPADADRHTNDPGRVPDKTDDGVYTVGKNLDAGIYLVETASAAKAGWVVYQNPDAGGKRTWPEVTQATRVAVSVQNPGTTLTLDHDSHFVDAAPVTDMAEIPTHAGLFLVGTDIAEGTYKLTAIDTDEFCTTEFGEEAPVDKTHPTLWHKTCARAAIAARSADQDIETWRGYVLEDIDRAGDISCVLEEGSLANLALLHDENPTVTIVGNIESGNTMDIYRSWLMRHNLQPVAAGDTVTVELKKGQVFAPVMMTCTRTAGN